MEHLSRLLGCSLILKVETANPIRSFKGRGADYFMQRLVSRGDRRQLVCASTGNFGQAMAWAARTHGRDVTVYADRNANRLKLGRVEAFGASVRLVGDDFDAAKDAAKAFCAETGAWMIEDGHEPEISEGAGSLAVELMQDEAVDVLVVPVGNGALISGVARWVKYVSPETRVIGVCASGADAMEKSWRGDGIVERETVETIAEGIAVRTPVPSAVEDMRPIVDEMMLVGDQPMLTAMQTIFENTGLLVEPAGTIGVAAIAQDPARFAGARVATILTGSNVTPDQTRAWLA